MSDIKTISICDAVAVEITSPFRDIKETFESEFDKNCKYPNWEQQNILLIKDAICETLDVLDRWARVRL